MGPGKGYGDTGEGRRGFLSFSVCDCRSMNYSTQGKNHLYLFGLWVALVGCSAGDCPDCLRSPTISVPLSHSDTAWLTMHFICLKWVGLSNRGLSFIRIWVLSVPKVQWISSCPFIGLSLILSSTNFCFVICCVHWTRYKGEKSPLAQGVYSLAEQQDAATKPLRLAIWSYAWR